MSNLGDTLAAQDKVATQSAKLTLTVDALVTATNPTYSVRLELPSLSEIVLEDVAVADIPAVVAEFTSWVTDRWA